MSRVLEKNIESRLGTLLKRWSSGRGVRLEYMKFTSPGRRGVPDRLIVSEGGRVIFLELKVPGEKPTKLQEYTHTLLRDMGFIVLVHDSAEEALEEIVCLLT